MGKKKPKSARGGETPAFPSLSDAVVTLSPWSDDNSELSGADSEEDAPCLSLYDQLMLEADRWGGLYAADTPENLKKWIENVKSSRISSIIKTKRVQARLELRNNERPGNLIGFNNHGHANICYANAAVQCLLALPPLCRLLGSWGEPLTVRPFYQSFHFMVNFVFFQPIKKSTISINIQTFLADVLERWQRKDGEQQDSCEFLQFVLQNLNDECKWKPRNAKDTIGAQDDDGFVPVGSKGKKIECKDNGANEDSPIKGIFGGRLFYSTFDKNHKQTSIQFEPFFVLHGFLNEELRTRGGMVHIQDILRSVAKTDPIDRGGKRIASFDALPMVLIISVNRFAYDKSARSVRKIFNPIAAEENLVIPKEFLRAPTAEPLTYKLRAIISHHGSSPQEGHYSTVALRDDQWYLFDDDVVDKVSATRLPTDGYVFCYIQDSRDVKSVEL